MKLKSARSRVLFLVLALTWSGGALRAAPEIAGDANATAKTAKAKSKAAAAPAPLSPAKIESWRLALLAPDEAAALDAAAALGSAGTSAARDPLIELLAAGATPARAQSALDALAKLGDGHLLGRDPTVTLEVLELYAGHRAPELRRRAIRVLGEISDPRAVPTLMERLGDAAPDVRASAAEALASRRDTKASQRMFALLKLGDAGVAAPLATIATPDLIPQIAELAGTIDDGIVASALGEYVKRADVPDKLRVDVLRTIGRLSGAAATTALVEYVASLPAKDDRPSKHEAQKLLDARGADQ